MVIDLHSKLVLKYNIESENLNPLKKFAWVCTLTRNVYWILTEPGHLGLDFGQNIFDVIHHWWQAGEHNLWLLYISFQFWH